MFFFLVLVHLSLTGLYVLLAVVEAELKTSKTVTENAIKYFYLQDLDVVP
jgi:hypothetical protein